MVVGNSSGPCRFCGGDGPLKKSHILPEFLYESLYDDKHRYVGIRPDPDLKNPFEQKGLREHLLCGDCESQFSAWETYAADVLRNLPDTTHARPGDAVEIRDVDYTKFKLFQLSLLWRAGVATHPAFTHADLGPHLEEIRQLLRDKDPGDRSRYGCVLIGFRGGRVERVGRLPIQHRVGGHRALLFLIGGLIWVFVVSSHSESIEGQASFLGKDGILRVHIGSGTAQQFLAGIGASLRKEGLL